MYSTATFAAAPVRGKGEKAKMAAVDAFAFDEKYSDGVFD